MKSLFLFIFLLTLPFDVFARDVKGNADPDLRFEINGGFYLGYRSVGTEDGKELETPESKGSAYSAIKIYFLAADVSDQTQDRIMFIGGGYRYQLNGNHGLIISPIAYKTPFGAILSMDFFTDAPKKGSSFGISLGFDL